MGLGLGSGSESGLVLGLGLGLGLHRALHAVDAEDGADRDAGVGVVGAIERVDDHLARLSVRVRVRVRDVLGLG